MRITFEFTGWQLYRQSGGMMGWASVIRRNKMNEEHEKFGNSCGGSRWFKGEPKIEEQRMIPVNQRWICPIDGCGGEMKFNGMTWPTGSPGYHHSCNKCEFTAAIHGAKYPRMTYVPDERPNNQ